MASTVFRSKQCKGVFSSQTQSGTECSLKKLSALAQCAILRVPLRATI